ncbi:MAG: LuxR C-terminal-related transcriptional regulator [Actinomycetota bacterium]|jgi:PAS domain S-box-containing protein|nr:LuxR C-terminal-related transcriptional regulator [Actinomycetota bacterium]
MEKIDFLKSWISKKNHESLSENDAKKLLKEFEQFLSYLFESIQDGISILDKNLNILGTNSAMENWYSFKKPFIGKKCYQIYHNKKSPCKDCPTIKAIKSKKSNVNIIKYKTPQNPEGWHELFSFPLFDDKNNVVGIIEYVRDITRTKKIQQVSDMLKKRLHLQNQTLQEQDTALKVLFREIEKEEKRIAENIVSNISIFIKPVLEELKIRLKKSTEIKQVEQIEFYLNKIIEPLALKLSSELYNLTPKEIQIASLIKEGKTTKEISEITGSSSKAIDFHRLNIRKKLGLTNKNINLQSYLLNLG